MALKTKAAIITELNLIATSLNSAFADTVSGVAAPVKDPRHPLRKLNKMFVMDNAGIITVNTNYINAVFNAAGTAVVSAPNSGSRTLMKKIA